MHPASVTASSPLPSTWGSSADHPARLARQGGPAWLARALTDSRRDTLATFAALEAALPGLVVPHRAELNPPLWELGHIGWFQAHWLGRFPAWRQGLRADPDGPRRAAGRPDADALYDSSRVPHGTRWSLPLPDAGTTRAHLQHQLASTLQLLDQVDNDAPDRDQALYFFRLALLHEDMHHEAALYMARALGVPIHDARWQAHALPAPGPALALEARTWRLGSEPDSGFAFDNELCAHPVQLGPCSIDAQVVRWAEFLPFISSGGYADDRCWSEAGRAWRHLTQATLPRYLRHREGDWQQWRQGAWQALALDEPAVHLSGHEAEAWCQWSGRRLPTEAEWEHAALSAGPAFHWGAVWEWTASPFAPYAGFEAHPYRDYSAPWFDGRPVLKGASVLTQPRMRHPRYRNFFPAGRNDIPAGFRSCAV